MVAYVAGAILRARRWLAKHTIASGAGRETAWDRDGES